MQWSPQRRRNLMLLDENLGQSPGKQKSRNRWRHVFREARKEARKELVGNLAELRKDGYSREALLESRTPVAKQPPSKGKSHRKAEEQLRGPSPRGLGRRI